MYKEISEYTAVTHTQKIEWQNNCAQINRKGTFKTVMSLSQNVRRNAYLRHMKVDMGVPISPR